jgi:hypothetical protein
MVQFWITRVVKTKIKRLPESLLKCLENRKLFSTGLFSFLAMLAGAAVFAAGLTLVVNPPGKKVVKLTLQRKKIFIRFAVSSKK